VEKRRAKRTNEPTNNLINLSKIQTLLTGPKSRKGKGTGHKTRKKNKKIKNGKQKKSEVKENKQRQWQLCPLSPTCPA